MLSLRKCAGAVCVFFLCWSVNILCKFKMGFLVSLFKFLSYKADNYTASIYPIAHVVLRKISHQQNTMNHKTRYIHTQKGREQEKESEKHKVKKYNTKPNKNAGLHMLNKVYATKNISIIQSITFSLYFCHYRPPSTPPPSFSLSLFPFRFHPNIIHFQFSNRRAVDSVSNQSVEKFTFTRFICYCMGIAIGKAETRPYGEKRGMKMKPI